MIRQIKEYAPIDRRQILLSLLACLEQFNDCFEEEGGNYILQALQEAFPAVESN